MLHFRYHWNTTDYIIHPCNTFQIPFTIGFTIYHSSDTFQIPLEYHKGYNPPFKYLSIIILHWVYHSPHKLYLSNTIDIPLRIQSTIEIPFKYHSPLGLPLTTHVIHFTYHSGYNPHLKYHSGYNPPLKYHSYTIHHWD